MKKYSIILLIILSISLLSCEKLIQPVTDNSITRDQLTGDPIFAEGLLMKAYAALPNDYNFETDVATDDAVTNDPTSVYKNMAVGGWKSTNNPIAQWNNAYENIYYINHFLSIYENVNWSTDPNLLPQYNELRNTLHKKRLKGEAFALRAWNKWRLLQYHGGVSEGGQLLGFPIIDEYMTAEDNWTLPRNTFAECVRSIFADLDTAIRCLPATWTDLKTGGTNPAINGQINATSGARYLNRINGNAAVVIKSRVALLAASPAFSASSGVTWAEAATIAGPLLKTLGSLYNKRVEFYLEKDNKEIIWNRAEVLKRTWEQNNFPPQLLGSGRTNPSQNLVDAFPMKNGYPITDLANSSYNPNNPYSNRDPRLAKYIVYNGTVMKTKYTINTYIDAPQDGINELLTSTRTGYYLKKFMNEATSLTPPATNASHTYTLARMTELLLNYAEAANEAWGPTGDPNGYGFTAKSLIGNLRSNAGITPDNYLAGISTTNALRDLIHNERRIELCFEGFRFWDLRRWNDVSSMQAPVKAVYITNNAGVYSYAYSVIEERKYTNDMVYGPVPYNETLKYNLEQNKGW